MLTLAPRGEFASVLVSRARGLIRPPCPSDWESCIPSKLPLLAAAMRPLLVSGRLKRGGERQLPLGLCVFPAPASTTRWRSSPSRRRAMPLVRRVCSGERHSRDRPSMFALSSLDCYWRCAARSLIAPRDFARFRSFEMVTGKITATPAENLLVAPRFQ